MITSWLFFLFITVVIINILYLFLFASFSFLKPKKENLGSISIPVSVVICAKNEAKNLQNNIPYWLKQDYPKFEIILINDASSDNTLEVMEEFQKNNSNIKIVNVENNEAFWGNKKYALTLGIKKTQYKHMLFTDADCKPASRQWILEMASHFSTQKNLVLGYGAYSKTKGFLNKLIRFETVLTALQYFSFAKVGIPYMGVGRNLAYTSELYYQNNGFMSHIKILSGDDDLFVNQAATKNNTAICFHKSSFTVSKPKKKWSQWLKQKKRHISTAKYYKPIHQFLLGLYFIIQILFWVLTVLSICFLDWQVILPIVFLRFLMYFIIIGKSILKLDHKDLLFFLPFLELFLILTQMSIFISNLKNKPTSWS